MSLAEVFYIMAIIYMSVGTLLLLALLIVVIYIGKKTKDVYEAAAKKVNQATEILSHPGALSRGIGEALAETALKQVKKLTG